MFEIAIALMAFAAVYLLPLTPQPRAKVIHWLDVVSYLLIAVGFGLMAIVLALGRAYWWFEAPWLGVMLAVGVASLTVAVVIELNRENPLLDIRWLASKEVVHFTGALLIFRIVLSEQTTRRLRLLPGAGPAERPDAAAVTGHPRRRPCSAGSLCAAIMKPDREHAIHIGRPVSAHGRRLMDSRATNLTRPARCI